MKRLVPALLGSIATVAAAQPATSPASRDPATEQAGTYKVDTDHTQVMFTVSHMCFSEYKGRFTGVDGSLELDPERVTATRLDITIPVASVSTTSPQLDGELKSDQWLDAGRFEQPDVGRRSELLTRWSDAPLARYAQPREDHLLPLLAAAGAGGRDRGRRAFRDTIGGKACSAYRFG